MPPGYGYGPSRNSGPMSGSAGALQALLALMSERRDLRREDESIARDEAARAADQEFRQQQLALTRRQIEQMEADAEQLRQLALVEQVQSQPGMELDSLMMERLGEFGPTVAETRSLPFQGPQNPNVPGGMLPAPLEVTTVREPHQPRERFSIPNMGIVEVGSSGDSRTLVEAPETYSSPTPGLIDGERMLVQLGSRGDVRNTGVGAPRSDAIEVANIYTDAQARAQEAMAERLNTRIRSSELVALLNERGRTDRARLVSEGQQRINTLTAYQKNLELKMKMMADNPQGVFDWGPWETPEALRQEWQQTQEQIVELQQAMTLREPELPGGGSFGGSASAPGVTSPPVGPTQEQAAREFLDRMRKQYDRGPATPGLETPPATVPPVQGGR